MLAAQHGIYIHVKKLQRYLSKAKLRRKNIVESPVEHIVAAIIEEVFSSGKYKSFCDSGEMDLSYKYIEVQ